MKKQLLLMITIISASLTLSAQTAIASDVYEQIFHVGNVGTATVGQIELDEISDGNHANGYSQFGTTGQITFSLLPSGDFDGTFLLKYRQYKNNNTKITLTIDGGTPIVYDDIAINTTYYTESNANGSYDFFLIPVTGVFSFTNTVAKNFIIDIADGSSGAGTGDSRRRFYNIAVTNSAVTPPLSIADNFITKNDIKLYPNPAADSFELNTKIDVNNVQIFSITGQLVKTLESVTNKYDISDLKSGLYLATINSDSGSGTIKLLKK